MKYQDYCTDSSSNVSDSVHSRSVFLLRKQDVNQYKTLSKAVLRCSDCMVPLAKELTLIGGALLIVF